MDIAVLMYEHCPESPEAQSGIPLDWPALVVEHCCDEPDERWQIMTTEQYETYRAQRMASYLAWAETRIET